MHNYHKTLQLYVNILRSETGGPLFFRDFFLDALPSQTGEELRYFCTLCIYRFGGPYNAKPIKLWLEEIIGVPALLRTSVTLFVKEGSTAFTPAG